MTRTHTHSRWRLWAALSLFVTINLVYWQDPWFWRNYLQFFLSGESETILGSWMAARGNRDDVLVATKMGKLPPYENLRPESIRAACDDSLRRLQTDRIDLYYAHFPEPGIAV